MKFVTTFEIISSLAVHACAMETFSRRSASSHLPTLPVDLIKNINSQSERILQNDDVLQCPICDRLSAIATLNPNVFPYPESPGYTDLTCGMANTNDYYETTYPESSMRCLIHQEYLEDLCCEFSGSQLESTLPHTCEEHIHSYVLTESYKSAVAPSPGRGSFTSVNTLITYWTTTNIDITMGKLEVIVDITLWWNDPRLAWNVTEDNCASSTFMRASLNPETTDIWVPSLDLGNRGESGVDSFPEAPAKVYSDGTVVWTRKGMLCVYCSFVGLRQMPFDNLGCQLIFTHPVYQKVVYNLVDGDGSARGITFGEYNPTYTEYKIIKEKTKSKSGGAIFTIDFFFSRARRQYIHVVLLPTIFFVYVSFGQFFYDPASEERISFCANALLIVVAQNIVTQSYIPICEESIWLNYITSSCQYFVLAGIFEALILFSLSKRHIRKTERRKGSFERIVNKDAVRNENSQHNSEESQNIVLQNEEDVHDSSLSDKRSILARQIQYLSEHSLSIMKRIDNVATFVLPLIFTVFLIVLSADNKNWADDPSEIWISV